MLSYARFVLSSDLLERAPSAVATPVVYFDVLQLFFVSYRRSIGTVINCLVLALTAFELRTLRASVRRATMMLAAAVVTPTAIGVALFASSRLIWFAKPWLVVPIFILVKNIVILIKTLKSKLIVFIIIIFCFNLCSLYDVCGRVCLFSLHCRQ